MAKKSDTTKLQQGDIIAMQGEVSALHTDGQVTVRLIGFDYPITTRGEHLNLVAKAKPSGRPSKQLRFKQA